MKIIFDVERLNNLLKAFSELTHITISLFDSEMNCIADAGTWKSYCLAIGEEFSRLEQCGRCNREHAAVALGLRQTCMYTCHAGIAEAVTPLFFEETHIGYLMIGKFRDAERIYASEERVVQAAEKYGLDKGRMLAAFCELPILNKANIDASIQILKAVIAYIVNERFIRFDRNILALEVERYIEEHLNEKLTVTALCKHFYTEHHDMCELFRSNFNETPQTYISKKRLQRAKFLLTSTEKSVREIAEEVGQSDYSYFIQTFKKQVGLSPLKYRKTHPKES